jgi:hypothetical protein
MRYRKANRSVTLVTCENRESNYKHSRRVQRGILQMRKVILFAVVALALTGVGAWIGVRAFTPTGAIAGASDQPPVMMTGAKGSPVSHYDDYDLVVH